MQLHLKLFGKTLVVSIVGEIDHHTAEDARTRIDNYIDTNSVKNIIFDFGKVNFMDSAGIGVIIGRYKRLQPMGGKVAIVSTGPQIKRVLEISGIVKIASIQEDINSALKYM